MRIRAFAPLMVASFVISPVLALAQSTNFVQEIAGADLTPSQNSVLEQLRALPSTQEVMIVRINPNALRDQAEVTLPLPGRAPVAVATGSRNILGDRSFSVAGRTETLGASALTNVSPGTSTFAVNGDSVTGTIQTDTGLYRLRPLGGGAHALIKAGAFPSEHPPSFNQRQDQQRDMLPSEKRSEHDTSIVDMTVLVAYTPAVAQRVADIKGLVDLAFLETNASYQSSGVYIRAIPATVDPIAVNYVEAGSHDADLAAFRDRADGKMDEIHQKMDDTKADVAVLLISDGSYCGLASDILAPSKEMAFVVVYHDCATGYYSFAHEIGHLQGARHNPEADSTSTPFAYGHGYMDIAHNRRTIMSYDCPNGCRRYPEWSRPSDWGTATLHHDARAINETRGKISSFR